MILIEAKQKLTAMLLNLAIITYSTPKECCWISSVSRTLSRIFQFLVKISTESSKCVASSSKAPEIKPQSFVYKFN